MRVYQRTFRSLVDAARTHRKTNGFPPSASMLQVGRRVQERTQRGGFRPYGCSLILARRRRLYTEVDQSRAPQGVRRGAGSASIQADLATFQATRTGRRASASSSCTADGRGVAVATSLMRRLSSTWTRQRRGGRGRQTPAGYQKTKSDKALAGRRPQLRTFAGDGDDALYAGLPIPVVIGCAPPSTRRAVRSVSSTSSRPRGEEDPASR